MNNLSISSGPQVIVNNDGFSRRRIQTICTLGNAGIHATTRSETTPKRRFEFHQPQSTVFKAFVDLSDDVSAIPKYIGGAAVAVPDAAGSGLAMLMNNAAKILQSVAANIDRDIFEQALHTLSDTVLLSDTTGMLTGRNARSGVAVAVQPEDSSGSDSLNSCNEVDMQIDGGQGPRCGFTFRATIGLDGGRRLSKRRHEKRKAARNKRRRIGHLPAR